MWIIVPNKGTYNTDFMQRIYENESGTYAEMDGRVVLLSENDAMCDILTAMDEGAPTVDVDAFWMR